MIGIQEIGYYIPDNFISNLSLKEKFEFDDDFIYNRVGIEKVARKFENDDTSDLCRKAFMELREKINIDISEMECLIVVTQNPDFNLPHTSAIVHGKLNCTDNCACFDISLGCSGYVYGLSVIKSIMESSGMKKGLLFTSDPYSKIINPEDKNTQVIFGDAASVTLLSEDYNYEIGKFTFGTDGKEHENLICREGELKMNGRAIFNFFARKLPSEIKRNLEKNHLSKEDIDLFVLHQGSKFIVEQIGTFSKLEQSRVVFDIINYGNTVSSSIPIILAKEFNKDYKYIFISGFGVGLSWASSVLTLNK